MRFEHCIACTLLPLLTNGCATPWVDKGPVSPPGGDVATSFPDPPPPGLGRGTPRLHLALDSGASRDHVELQVLDGWKWVTRQSGGPSGSRSVMTQERTGHALCTLPCDGTFDGRGGQLFRFDGPWIRPSPSFSLAEESGELWFTVRPGSATVYTTGSVFMGLGALGTALGLLVTSLSAGQASQSRGGLIAGGSILGTSVAVLGAGIAMMVTSDTTFSMKRLVPVASPPPPP